MPYFDPQTAADFMNNLSNQSFVYSCYNTVNAQLQTATKSFTKCDDLTFCIGKRNQQHACFINQCQVVDWSVNAPTCNAGILNYTALQPAGLVVPCCDSSSFCTSATIDPSSSQFHCSSGTTMHLCASTGSSAECINPLNTTDICSGNFTAQVPPQSSQDGGGPNKAVVIGIPAGVANFLLILFLLWCCCCRQPRAVVKTTTTVY